MMMRMKSASVFLAVLLIVASAFIAGETLGLDKRSETFGSEAPMDCTFSYRGTIEGVSINVTVTVSSVSLAECIVMKAAVKAAAKK